VSGGRRGSRGGIAEGEVPPVAQRLRGERGGALGRVIAEREVPRVAQRLRGERGAGRWGG
jgi:hypothetical protein